MVELKLTEESKKLNGMLHKSFGIEDGRVTWMADQLKALFEKSRSEVPEEERTNVATILGEASKFCKDVNEIVWCAFNLGYNIGRMSKSSLKILNVGSIEEMKAVIEAAGKELDKKESEG